MGLLFYFKLINTNFSFLISNIVKKMTAITQIKVPGNFSNFYNFYKCKDFLYGKRSDLVFGWYNFS